jgi:hypothetical protein
VTTPEKPRDVYLDACRVLASGLEPLGFRYAASKQVASRRAGEFTHAVSFQSSHRNIAGAHVVVWIHANVFWKVLGKWRASGPALPWTLATAERNDFVAGGQLGNLQTPTAWLEWNVAVPASRERVLSEAQTAIERLGLAYFARFEQLSEVLIQLRSEDIPGLDPLGAVQLLACAADVASAQQYLQRFLAAHPAIHAEYSEALAVFRVDGLPAARKNHGRDLAAAALVYGLERR